jgi:hypothetical protein
LEGEFTNSAKIVVPHIVGQVSIPPEDRQTVLEGCEDPDKINGAQKLDPTAKLSKVFTEPVDEHLHIIVKRPDLEQEAVEEERRDEISALHNSAHFFFFLSPSLINTIQQGLKTSSRAF